MYNGDHTIVNNSVYISSIFKALVISYTVYCLIASMYTLIVT